MEDRPRWNLDDSSGSGNPGRITSPGLTRRNIANSGGHGGPPQMSYDPTNNMNNININNNNNNYNNNNYNNNNNNFGNSMSSNQSGGGGEWDMGLSHTGIFPHTRGDKDDHTMLRASQKASSFFPIREGDASAHAQHETELEKKLKEAQATKNRTGMFVYAKHLFYSIPHKKKESVDILSDISFLLKPKEMTLILGSPGCGKTALFKTLAGQVKADKLRGDLLFNGRPINYHNHHRELSMVTQDDDHYALLTVKETVRFALDCTGDPLLTAAEKEERVEILLRTMGLDHVKNTLVGDNLVRGVSGGQKKRVTISTSIIKGADLILMDEPTTGLDSSTAYDLLCTVRKFVDILNVTALVTLLQPSAQLSSLFDNLIILTEGKIAYFGPMSEALDYFESLGFICPKHSNPSEFFQEIVDDPARYSYHRPPRCQTPDDFVNAYRASPLYQSVLATIDANPSGVLPPRTKEDFSDNTDLPKFAQPMYKQTFFTVKRGFIMAKRNYINDLVRILKGTIVGCILGFLFYRLDHNQLGGQNRFGLIFFAMTFIIFSSFGALQEFFQHRHMFNVQRKAYYYGTLPFFTSNMTYDLPARIIEILVFASIVYWVSNMRATFVRFGYWLIMFLLVDQLSVAFIKMFSSFSPNVAIGNVISGAVMGIFLLVSGFMAPRNVTPGWWIWLYYLSPYTYVFQGLAINEFQGQPYHCKTKEYVPPIGYPLLNVSVADGGYGGAQACQYTHGEQFLRLFGMHTNNGYKYICIVIVAIFTIFCTFVAFLGMHFIRFNTKPKDQKRIPVKGFLGYLGMTESIEKSNASRKLKRASKLSKGSDHSAVQTDNAGNIIIPPNGDPTTGAARQSRSDTTAAAAGSSSGAITGDGSYISFDTLSYAVDYQKPDENNPKKKVKVKLQLLDKISGYAKPGEMLALMGPSGAGKSTLLDVIAGRKTGGYIDGQILVNGKPKDKFFTRGAAYIEQQDILPPTQTVREAIMFSANLRLDPTVRTPQDRANMVDRIINILMLTKIKDLPIGLLGDGISLSQRKRVNIGVELASGPEIIFLDEPTSGLDSGAAYKVIKLVSRVAKNFKRTIICTIHQPSVSIFEKFDKLLLLKKGGETIYFGPLGHNSETVLSFFARSNMHIAPHYNPADFVLEVADGTRKPVDPAGNPIPYDPVEEYKQSQYATTTQDELRAGILPPNYTSKVYTEEFAVGWATQFRHLQKRAFISRLRRPMIIASNIMRSIVLSVLIGTLFVNLGREQQDARSLVAIIFFSLLFGGMCAIAIIPVVCLERSVYYRERSAGFYRVSPYMLTYLISGYPFLFLAVVAYVVPVFFITDMNGGHSQKFFFFLFILFIVYITMDMIAFFLSSAMPNDVVATLIMGVMLSLSSLFAGFMIPRPSIAKGWLFLHYMDVIRYPFEALATDQFDGSHYKCTNNKGAVPVNLNVTPEQVKWFCPIQDGTQYLESYGFHRYLRYIDIGIMFGFYFIFFIGSYLALKFIRWQVR
ncbi:hypothetical protein SAMD00019534_050940 [Acytostelium subglobosum LB1]|uniref:hypothetical protein n=1 Tax=Acytostelium subglobosum LB1 TaxID=1410327 RepID=UPI000645121C|nr:hypothetical protein SAMD00019534_050940 [Acytostelium subglobosum LB1]GAM21919.1 hypothetical protein SAMD00019534_050940 [Acytostelium subglobosum LB1]|eukprot:XP_012755019.1 hypothetical protein SAMD00019534_050940 [Acytostelium subglobosum LB1]